VTDAQWALIEPLLPPPATRGRAEKHPRREIVNAILYLDRAGCLAAFAPALPTVGDGLLALGALEERRHRRPGA
jgi:transposase